MWVEAYAAGCLIENIKLGDFTPTGSVEKRFRACSTGKRRVSHDESAARHMMRVSASENSAAGCCPAAQCNCYEQMLVKLAADNRTLKQIRSNERKGRQKRELLPFYLPWVAGVLATAKARRMTSS